ncbi:ALI_collapsed_G0000910.mRNA.1.CDS.1 [Saccharomyces cerevisiae]|nr:ALI_collapsed_G0000910.mRNA.1.CDS.1 [Saccharomyces cerevisiae]
MNQYLFNHGQWHTPYYFYGDEDCYRYFLSLVEGVTPKKQTPTSIGYSTGTQLNSSVTAESEDAIESASPIITIVGLVLLMVRFHDNKPCVPRFLEYYFSPTSFASIAPISILRAYDVRNDKTISSVTISPVTIAIMSA